MERSEQRRWPALPPGWRGDRVRARPERRGPWGWPRLVWLVLAGALICGESQAQGVASPSQVSEYHSWLGKVEQELRTLADSSLPSSEWSERLRRLPSSRPRVDSGTSARETALPWRTAWLSEGVVSILLLPEGETVLRRAEALQLADQTARLRRMISGDPDRGAREAREAEDRIARARLEEILADPAYHTVPTEEPDAWRQLWRELRLRLARLLDDLLGEEWRGRAASDTLGTETPAASSSFPILRVLIGLGVGATVLLSARRWLMSRPSRQRFGQSRTEPGTREVLGEILADGIHPAQLVDQADRLAGEEDFRTAIRLIYLATLIHLADLEMITLHPAISNRDYVQSLRHEEKMASLFVHLTVRFEEAWYGSLPTSRAEYEDSRESYTALAAAADLRPPESRP